MLYPVARKTGCQAKNRQMKTVNYDHEKNEMFETINKLNGGSELGHKKSTRTGTPNPSVIEERAYFR